MVQKIFKVTGMHCGSCEMLVTDAVESAFAGNKVAKASTKEGIVEVVAPSPEGMAAARKAIEAEGYKVVG